MKIYQATTKCNLEDFTRNFRVAAESEEDARDAIIEEASVALDENDEVTQEDFDEAGYAEYSIEAFAPDYVGLQPREKVFQIDVDGDIVNVIAERIGQAMHSGRVHRELSRSAYQPPREESGSLQVTWKTVAVEPHVRPNNRQAVAVAV